MKKKIANLISSLMLVLLMTPMVSFNNTSSVKGVKLSNGASQLSVSVSAVGTCRGMKGDRCFPGNGKSYKNSYWEPAKET